MSPQRIPLFPLEVVLFPEASLPLHIFEPRYKEMIGLCLADRREFGVVLAAPQGFVEVGCTAAIVQLLRRHADGRLDIMTVGRNRFRIVEVVTEKSYFEADVAYLPDNTTAVPTHTAALLRLFHQCHQVIYGRSAHAPADKPPASLAYALANELPFALEFKQQLLELCNEAERQQLLVDRLESWLPQLVRLDHVRKRAGGNGHGFQRDK
jgi:ATP-dependent Lon protease